MITRWIVNHIIRFISSLFLKVDQREINKIPFEGPLLVVVNHVNFLDAPVMITQLHPRELTGLVKKETWDNALHRFLFNVWDGIPIDREVADFAAFSAARSALRDGKILAVAPEGTRTEDGVLIRGKPGVAMLAAKADVPILPVALFGHERFKRNLKKLKRTPMTVRVGEPFKIQLNGQLRDKGLMQTVTDEIMVEIAKLLPESYRGIYADQVQGNQQFVTR
ncbi:MAG: lysophospholipid acyltransferase family protein [Chloroflexota bacterium]|nr:lysophospholipid acyltransferase family protein [Chloroflexota bacterium]